MTLRSLPIIGALIALLALLGGCRSDAAPSEPSIFPPEPPPSASTAEFGRVYTAWLYAAQIDALWAKLAPEVRDALGGPDALRRLAADLRAQGGEEVAVVHEWVTSWLGAEIYNRTATFSRAPARVLVQWTLAPRGTIAGLLVTLDNPAPSRFLDYETKAVLELPFNGEWFVFWGGRELADNYHAVAVDQRFAIDVLIVRDGSTHAADGTRNEDYYCYGEPVLAPGAGTVVVAADGRADHGPLKAGGSVTDPVPPGNHVIIDHGAGEFSLLAHLRQGSVAVRAGDSVHAGDVIGRCGNSGNSSEPHLHYHLQTAPEFGRGEGLPAQFRDYVADGHAVARGEPTRGQRIRRQ